MRTQKLVGYWNHAHLGDGRGKGRGEVEVEVEGEDGVKSEGAGAVEHKGEDCV